MSEVLRPGAVVGSRYRVERLLGAGAMGEVYVASHEALERRVALKVIRAERRGAMMSSSRFMREAKVAARIRHPGAVAIHDFGEDGELLFLVMELLSGPSLRALVDVGLPRLPLERTLRYTQQLAAVLEAAAKIGVVHRDLKPENVMLHRADDDHRLVIVDFGLAHDLEESGSTSRMTREGIVTGTPDYLSPEQARGERCTPASDVYSLGCVLFEMLTGQPPFGDAPVAVLLTRHIYAKPPGVRESVPDVTIPGALEDLVQQMLSKESEDRPTAAAVVRAVQALDPSAPSRFSGRSGPQGSKRSQRMVSVRATTQLEAPDARPVPPGSEPGACQVAWRGHPPEEVRTALEVGGIGVVPEGAAAGALVVEDASIAEIQKLRAAGTCIVAVADAADLERLQALIAAGVAEVLVSGRDPSDWARTIARALRKNQRRKHS